LLTSLQHLLPTAWTARPSGRSAWPLLVLCVAVLLPTAARGEVNLLEYPIRQPWTLLGSATVEIVDDEPVIVCAATPDKEDAAVANVTVTVPPETRALQLSASIRAQTLVPGKQGWHTARVVMAMLDEEQQVLGYGGAIELHRSSDWVRQRGWLQLKPGTRYVRVVVGNHARRGTAWFRDISVTAAPPFTAHPFEPGLPLGTFEYAHPDGFAKGWFLPTGASGHVTLAQQAGNTFLRVHNPDASTRRSIGHVVELPDSPRVTVSVRMRCPNLAMGDQGWQTAMLRWHFLDAEGNRVGGWPDPPRLTEPSAEWQTLTAAATVPPGARYARLEPGLYHANGTAEFDNVQLTPAR